MNESTYYRYTFTAVVLTDRQIDLSDEDLSSIMRETDTGDFVLASYDASEEELTAEEMTEAMWNAGSDPTFFGTLSDRSDNEED